MNDGQVLQQILFFALLVGGLYLLAIRPQRARARALAEVRAALAPGAAVVTTAGIHATVRAVEDGTVVLEIAPGVLVRFADAAVVRILSPDVDEPDPDDVAPQDREPVHPEPATPDPAHPELTTPEPHDSALGRLEPDPSSPGGAGLQSSGPHGSTPQSSAPQGPAPQEPAPQEPGPPARGSRRRPHGPGPESLGGDRP